MIVSTLGRAKYFIPLQSAGLTLSLGWIATCAASYSATPIRQRGTN